MSAPSSHTGRVAVVTGAAGGFGTAISCELAHRGADIIDLNPSDDTVSAVQEIGQKAGTPTARDFPGGCRPTRPVRERLGGSRGRHGQRCGCRPNGPMTRGLR
jgi:NAD(P)-dependent dehydrogenase (short-subunit alcohol dehydrogenase family)